MQTNSIITQNHRISTAIASIGQAAQAPLGAGLATFHRSQDCQLCNVQNLEQRKSKRQSSRRSHKISKNTVHANTVLSEVSFISAEKQVAKSTEAAVEPDSLVNRTAKDTGSPSILFNSTNQFRDVLEVTNV
ncbi:MAG: hypothetical protein KJ077_25745 [Anaerolineae bacterium]|nr:hypothetical protein [Anaerolineae bacterium]